MGKTAMAVTIAANAAAVENTSDDAGTGKHRNYVVGVFSLEMSAEQLATRLLSGKGRIESDRLRRGDIAEEEWPVVVRASQELGAMPLFIDDTPALSIGAAAHQGPAPQAHAGAASAGGRLPAAAARLEHERRRPTACRRSPRSPRA